jgi:hypothetical protein
MAARHRPRRGDPGPDVLEQGDVGEYHPQGGAREDEDVFRESGNLGAREFGVPQADLPGGKGHFINLQAPAEKPAIPPERPADYHKYHGVPSDDGQYEVPEAVPVHQPKPAPVEKIPDAVPVYLVERTAGSRSRRIATTDTVALPAVGTDPTRICNRDDSRDEIMLLCTDASNNALFSEDRASLADATATDHGRCAFLPKAATSYTRVATQGELWATSDAATGSHVAIIIITTVPA